MNTVRTNNGIMVAAIDDLMFQRVLRNNSGFWTEKNYADGSSATVYQLKDDGNVLTLGGDRAKIYLWKDFYICPND